MAIKDSKYIKINSVNPLYLTIKVNGYFGEINRSKYLTLVPANEIKEKIKKKRKNMENYEVKSDI